MQSRGTGSHGNNINNSSPMDEGIPDSICPLHAETRKDKSLEVDSVPDGPWLSNDGSVLVLPTHRDPESQMQLFSLAPPTLTAVTKEKTSEPLHSDWIAATQFHLSLCSVWSIWQVFS